MYKWQQWIRPTEVIRMTARGLKILFIFLFCAASIEFRAACYGQGGANASMPDIEVFDQDGRKLHFYTDLIKGKTVVLSFIYTSCTAICPMMGRSFSRLQSALGERLGKDVYLISISMDPETDTPERLKAWGAQFGAKPGWILVTGEKGRMDTLLKFMRGDPARKGDHTPAVLIGNYDRGVWIREFGLAEPRRYTQILQSILSK